MAPPRRGLCALSRSVACRYADSAAVTARLALGDLVLDEIARCARRVQRRLGDAERLPRALVSATCASTSAAASAVATSRLRLGLLEARLRRRSSSSARTSPSLTGWFSSKLTSPPRRRRAARARRSRRRPGRRPVDSKPAARAPEAAQRSRRGHHGREDHRRSSLGKPGPGRGISWVQVWPCGLDLARATTCSCRLLKATTGCHSRRGWIKRQR